MLNINGLKNYLFNSGWILIDRVVRFVLGITIGIMVARYLGPKDYGILNYVLSLTGIISIIGTFGMDSVVIKDLVKYKKLDTKIIYNAMFLKFIGAVLVIITAQIVAYLFHLSDEIKLFIFIVTLSGLFNFLFVIDLFYKSKVLMKKIVKLNILTLIGVSSYKLLLIFIKASLIFFFFSPLLEAIIGSFLKLGVILKDGYLFYKNKISFFYIKKLLSQSWPFIIMSLIAVIYTKIDQIMIFQILGAKENGLYAAATRLSNILFMLPGVVSGSFYIAILNAKKVSKDLFYKRLKALYFVMFWGAILLILPFLFFSKEIILILYGKQYELASDVLSVYIWCVLFVFISAVTNMWFVIENKQKISMYFNLTGLVINIILNIILIKTYGIMGAALATLTAYAVNIYVCLLCNKKTQKLFVFVNKSIWNINSIKGLK